MSIRSGFATPASAFVAFPLDLGNEAEVRGALRQFAPVLWAEGLALPVHAALAEAEERGVPGAAEAIVDVRARGPRAAIVRVVIRRLAADLNADSKEVLRRCG